MLPQQPPGSSAMLGRSNRLLDTRSELPPGAADRQLPRFSTAGRPPAGAEDMRPAVIVAVRRTDEVSD